MHSTRGSRRAWCCTKAFGAVFHLFSVFFSSRCDVMTSLVTNVFDLAFSLALCLLLSFQQSTAVTVGRRRCSTLTSSHTVIRIRISISPFRWHSPCSNYMSLYFRQSRSLATSFLHNPSVLCVCATRTFLHSPRRKNLKPSQVTFMRVEWQLYLRRRSAIFSSKDIHRVSVPPLCDERNMCHSSLSSMLLLFTNTSTEFGIRFSTRGADVRRSSKAG